MTANGTPIVELVDVTKLYRQGAIEVPALRGLTLSVEPGEFTAICGPSGSGKTTTLNLIGALDRPTSGSVAIEGRDLAPLSRKQLSRLRRDRIGFVFQAYNLMPVLTAYENAEIVLSLQGVDAAERRERVMKLLADVGLEGLERRRPDELSGGQQQRVAIARVLVQSPEVILADEPVASVDPNLAHSIVKLLLEISEASGKTLLMNLHSMDLALTYFPRIIGFRDGRVQFDRPPVELTEDLLARLYAGISRTEAQDAGMGTDHDSPFTSCGPLLPGK